MSFQFAFILPTTECHVHCEHCFYEVGHSERVEAVDYLYSLDDALEQLSEEGLQQVIISGGEPLLSPRLPQVLELCSARVLHLLLLTHGDLLDKKKLADLEALGVDDITLSARAVEDGLKEKINRVLFQSRFLPTLLASLTRRNLRHVPGLLELSSHLGVPVIFTPAYIPEDHALSPELSLRGMAAAEEEALWEALLPWAQESHTLPYLSLLRDFYAGRGVHPGHCPMGTQGLVIDADGSVYPCFHRRDLCAGNLIVHPWPQIAARLKTMAPKLQAAPCFGEHCLSMFVGVK